MTAAIKIGISACLIGARVRYDGSHKLDRCITDILGEYFTFVPVCPEVGCGLPTPREAMQLEGDPAAPRLMTLQSRVDKTEQMLEYCASKAGELEQEGLCGFIFKERSPSCGFSAVPLHGHGSSETLTIGLFAKKIACNFPLIPLVEAERLNDPAIREDFIKSVLNSLESP